MPTFDVDSIKIEPEEFWRECSGREEDELMEIIKDKYDFKTEDEFLEEYGEFSPELVDKYQINAKFVRGMLRLINSWAEMSQEDEDILMILAKKYGSV